MSTLLAIALLTATPHDNVVSPEPSARLLPRDLELPGAGVLTGRALLTPVLMAAGAGIVGGAALGTALLISIPFPLGQLSNRDPNLLPLYLALGTGAVVGAVMGALGAAAFASPDPLVELRIALPYAVLLTALVGAALMVAALLEAPLLPVLAVASSSFCVLPVLTAVAKASRAREKFGVEVAAF